MRRNFHTYYYRASDNIDVFGKAIKVLCKQKTAMSCCREDLMNKD